MKLTARQIGRLAEHIETALKNNPTEKGINAKGGPPQMQKWEQDAKTRIDADPELPPYSELEDEELTDTLIYYFG